MKRRHFSGFSIPTRGTLSGVTWYRAIQTGFLGSALATAHTAKTPSRFNAALPPPDDFEVLYLAETHLVALLEVGALLGASHSAGSLVSSPRTSWTILNVKLNGLSDVLDLTGPANQDHFEITAQELTGDWRGYLLRNMSTTVSVPKGEAPTQELGAALFKSGTTVRAFQSLSARDATSRILACFPQRLARGMVTWWNPITGVDEDAAL